MSLKQVAEPASHLHQHKPFIRRATYQVANDDLRLNKQLRQHQHEQEDKLEQAGRFANRMAQLLEVLPGGVVVLSGQGLVQQCNAAATSMLGQPLQDELWAEVIERAFAPKSDNSPDIALLDGRLVHISTSPLIDEPGQIVLLNDVTETRRLQLKVSHLQRLSAMGEVAARLAHQIRTPLSSAMLYLSPLMKEDTPPKLRQNFAKKLHNSIRHMEGLIKDMLAFSRGDMASTAPVSVGALCEIVEQQFQSQEGAGLFNLQVNNAMDNAFVYGSQDALSSAINNLLNNARLACEPEGEITIFADYIEDDNGAEWVEISVEDNGVGIAPAEQDKILTPFYTTRSSGTGLGLPVVNSIIKAHRGTLWFASDQGEGSTFSIRLPKYKGSHHKAQMKQEQDKELT
jgi:two-component system sensor histidine kinase FlrB